jgi:hypothetical protein
MNFCAEPGLKKALYVLYAPLITCKMQIVRTENRLIIADCDSGKRQTCPLYQRERPTTTSLQLSDSNKDLVLSSRWVLYSKTARNDQVKEDDTGRACSTNGVEEECV